MKSVYRFGEFELDPANKALLRNGLPVPLTPKVFDTLALLVERSGQLVEKDEFMRQLWPETFVEDAALAENVSRLRRALGDVEGQRLIVTLPKRGYRFAGDVTRVVAPDPGAPVEAAALPPPAPVQPAPQSPASSIPGSFAWRGLTGPSVAALLCVAVVLGLGVAYVSSGLASRSPSGAAAMPIRSLAVLPLDNLSRDPEQEYFADGMTDELITQLAKISAVRVISRTSVMRFKGTKKPLAEIARELNVDAIVEGTVARSPERVRVTAKVVQANPERDLWAERYDRPLGDIFLLQGELAREISQAIRVALTPQEQTRLAGPRPVSREAHEAFLKGRYYWSRRTEEATRKAIAYFQEAIDRDPGYALAYTGLADSEMSLALSEALQEVVPPREAFPKARAAARRALEIDDGLAEAHASLAHIEFQYDRDWAGSEKEFRRAIALNPNYANAHHWYALSLMWMGRPDEALQEIERARELDPLSLTINANHGFLLAGAHQYEQGVTQCQKALELDPGYAHGHYRLGQIHLLRGAPAQAVPELERAIALSAGSPRAKAELGLAHAMLGHTREALALLAELKGQSARRYVSPFNMAVIYGGLGDQAQALAWLERAQEERSPSLSLLNTSPAFAGLRSQPRFRNIVRSIGLPL